MRPHKKNLETETYRMKKIASSVVGMLFALYLAPKTLEAKSLVVFFGPYSPNLKEVNDDLDEAFNKQFGTNFRFKADGFAYGIAPQSKISPNKITRVDISFFRVSTGDSYTTYDPPIGPHEEIRREVEADMTLTAIPLIITRIYEMPSKGRLFPYLGAGAGIFPTLLRTSREDTVYFSGSGDIVKESGGSLLTSVPLGGQILAGIEYELNPTKNILLEARYIASSKAKIQGEDFETIIDWSGFSYRMGLMIRF